MHVVVVEDADGVRRDLVLRRWARVDRPPDVGVVDNECAALRIASAAAVPTPTLIAADPSGADADVPAVLMSRLRGRDVVAPPDRDAWLTGLAHTLHTIHDTPLPEGELGYFRPWGLDTVTAPPWWTKKPRAWERAIAIANEPVPAHARVFVHRDFHPGNVLWSRGHVSGVVDWTHSCRGPAAADVAHCRLNLAILFGIDAADDFARRYGELPDQAWHDIADVVGMGGAGPPETWRWDDAGRPDIATEDILAALDALLLNAAVRLG